MTYSINYFTLCKKIVKISLVLWGNIADTMSMGTANSNSQNNHVKSTKPRGIPMNILRPPTSFSDDIDMCLYYVPHCMMHWPRKWRIFAKDLRRSFQSKEDRLRLTQLRQDYENQ